jgi:hypothetical protein
MRQQKTRCLKNEKFFMKKIFRLKMMFGLDNARTKAKEDAGLAAGYSKGLP